MTYPFAKFAALQRAAARALAYHDEALVEAIMHHCALRVASATAPTDELVGRYVRAELLQFRKLLRMKVPDLEARVRTVAGRPRDGISGAKLFPRILACRRLGEAMSGVGIAVTAFVAGFGLGLAAAARLFRRSILLKIARQYETVGVTQELREAYDAYKQTRGRT